MGERESTNYIPRLSLALYVHSTWLLESESEQLLVGVPLQLHCPLVVPRDGSTRRIISD